MKAHTSTSPIADAGDRVKSTLSELISSTEDLLRSTASYGGSEVESVRDRLKRQLDNAREHARAGERSARERYHHISSATDGYVHENAWKTAGVAIVVGLLIGAALMSDSWRNRE